MVNVKAAKLIEQLKKAEKCKTLYVMGGFGAPLTPANKERWINGYGYNQKPERKQKILSATDDTFSFDCVCLVKGILWGWNADVNDVYGGAVPYSNGVPDIGTEAMIGRCSEVSTNFSTLTNGELLWLQGHVGVVVDAEKGLAIECSPKWSDGVQYSSINRNVLGYNRRDWTKHGKMPWVDYSSGNELVKEFQRWLNKTYGCDLAVDGVCGKKTKTEACKGMQIQLNKLGEDLEVDGKCWELTQAALSRHMVKKGQKGNRVYLVQGLLYGWGYDPKGFDGSFGEKTDKAVKEYQTQNTDLDGEPLEVDGKVGGLTFARLVN